MEQLLQSYQTRLAQLTRGSKELYEGEREIIQELIRACRDALDN